MLRCPQEQCTTLMIRSFLPGALFRKIGPDDYLDVNVTEQINILKGPKLGL